MIDSVKTDYNIKSMYVIVIVMVNKSHKSFKTPELPDRNHPQAKPTTWKL